MSSNRNILTWSLNAGTQAYERDLAKYGNKIYAIGVHEFQVDGDGLVYVRRTMSSTTTPVPNTGQRADSWSKADGFWKAIEDGMKRWPHIGWYYSFILFGATRVTQMLDTQASQDQFIAQIGAVLDHHAVTDDTGRNLIKGVEIDFEATFSEDEYDARTGDDDKYLAILRRVKEEICIPRGLVLQVNGYAMWGNQNPFYYRFHNYAKWSEARDSRGGSVIDELQIMQYDFSWNGSAPGPSTPLWWAKNVGDWAYANFGSTPRNEGDVDKASGADVYHYNSGAVLTMDKVFLGAAAYGHRWPMFDQANQYGSTITYRNLIGWQNGKYRHSHTNASGVREWHDQEFLQQAGIEDQESKNELLYQHVYDMNRVKYATISPVEATEEPSGRKAVYNDKEYITTYSRLQQAEFTNVHHVAKSATVSGYAHQTPVVEVIRRINGEQHIFNEYRIDPVAYVGNPDTKTCSLDTKKPAGKVTFAVDVPAAGYYSLVILLDMPMFGQSTIAGNVNGTAFIVGENLPDSYPLYFKGPHYFDMGDYYLNAGANTIEVTGEPNSPNPKSNTPFYGFIVCDQFTNKIEGGRFEFDVNIQPFKKKDGTDAAIPASLVAVGQALRQDARPAILFEDRFAQYVGKPEASDLTAYGYYLNYSTEHVYSDGRGQEYSEKIVQKPDPANPGQTVPVVDQMYCRGKYTAGLSKGTWTVDRGTGAAYVTTNTIGKEAAQFVLNYKFKGNTQIEAEFSIVDGDKFGLMFGMTDHQNGFAFIASYTSRWVGVFKITNGVFEQLYTEPLSDALDHGTLTKMRVRNHNGVARFYLGYGNKRVLSPDFNVGYTGGAAGVWSSSSEVRVYMFGVSTTDKWELMEKFELEVNGETKRFGAITRSAQVDEWGLLDYSGLDERSTRETETTGIALDYEYFMHHVAGWQGPAKVKVRLIDAGIWFSELLVGDSQGCSITWCGDAQSFLYAMNMAVEDYGAKGIGLWTMGQEDPRVFEVIPDVVPYYE